METGDWCAGLRCGQHPLVRWYRWHVITCAKAPGANVPRWQSQNTVHVRREGRRDDAQTPSLQHRRMVPSDGRRLYAVKAYSLAAAPAELCRLQDLRSGLHVRRDELMTAEADHSAAQEAKQESVASAFLLVC